MKRLTPVRIYPLRSAGADVLDTLNNTGPSTYDEIKADTGRESKRLRCLLLQLKRSGRVSAGWRGRRREYAITDSGLAELLAWMGQIAAK